MLVDSGVYTEDCTCTVPDKQYNKQSSVICSNRHEAQWHHKIKSAVFFTSDT